MAVAFQVESVQILAVEIVSEHAFEDSLRIHHGDYAELEIFPEQVGAIIYFVG